MISNGDCDANSKPDSNSHAPRRRQLRPRFRADTGQITLSARGYKVQGRQTVDLSWNGATSNNIDIYRNSVLIATVPNILGFYTDHIGVRGKGTYTYKVCEAGTQNSN
jgi:hypothetical protein